MSDRMIVSKEHLIFQVAYGVWVFIIPVVLSVPAGQGLAAAQGLWLEMFLLVYALSIGVLAPEVICRYFQYWIANRLGFTTCALIIQGRWILLRNPMLHLQAAKNPHSGVYAFKRNPTLHEVRLFFFSGFLPPLVLAPAALLSLWPATVLPKPAVTFAFGLLLSFGAFSAWIIFNDFVYRSNPQSLWGGLKYINKNSSDILTKWNAHAVAQEVQCVRPRDQSEADLETIQILRDESAFYALMPYWRAIDLGDLELAEAKLWYAETFVVENPNTPGSNYVWHEISQFSCAFWNDRDISDSAYAMWAADRYKLTNGRIELVRESKWGDRDLAKQLLKSELAKLDSLLNQPLRESHLFFYEQFVPELFEDDIKPDS